MRILVAIPCYRCGPQIERVLNEFDDSLLKRVGLIAIFDNRSPDDTVIHARRAAEKINQQHTGKIKIFVNNENYGLSGTHKAAFLFAEKNGFDAVAILHGDNQAKTIELNELIDLGEKHPEAAAILGARFMRSSRLMGYSLIRTLGNRALNLVYTLLSGRQTYDLGSGLNLFRLKPLTDHAYLSFADAFTFNMDLLLDYYRKKCRLIFHPITKNHSTEI